MIKKRQTSLELCLEIADLEDTFRSLSKQNKKSNRLTIINELEIQEKTYFKYVRIGRFVRANPQLNDKHLSMRAIEEMMRPGKMTSIDYKAEYKRLIGFTEFLKKRMGEDTYRMIMTKYEATLNK